jgi:MFS family permease
MGNNLMGKRQPGFYYGYVVVAAVFIIMAIIWGTFSTIGVFFGSFIETFGWTRALTSGASSVRDLAFGVVCILAARLAGPFGPRVVITTSGLLLGVGYLLMSRVQTTWQLYLYFGIIISSGMSSYILMLSIVAKWFERRRGIMTALSLSGMGIGTMVVPPVSNRLISTYGWRTSYIIIAIFASVIVVLAAQLLRLPPNEPHHATSIDNSASEDQTVSDNMAISFRKAFGTKQFRLISALYFFFLFPLLTVLVHVVIHATGLGVSSKSAASIIAIIGGLSVVGMNCAGSTADRIGNKRTFIICFILMAVSFVVLLAAGAEWSLYLFSVIFGLAYGGMQVLFSPMVAELFGMTSHGVILAGAALIGGFGAALGPLVSGHIFDLTKGYGWAFFTCLIMTLLSVMLASLLKPVRK